MEKKLKRLDSYGGNIVLYDNDSHKNPKFLTKMYLITPKEKSKLGDAEVAEKITHACRLKVLERISHSNPEDKKLITALRIYGGYAKPAVLSGLKDIMIETLLDYPVKDQEIDFLVETADVVERKRLMMPNLNLPRGYNVRSHLIKNYGRHLTHDIDAMDASLEYIGLDLRGTRRIRKSS